MHTLEINGRAVAVTDADEAEANAIFHSDSFKDDIRQFTSGGQPVWDGTSPFTVRAANEEEQELFDDASDEELDFDLDEDEEAAEDEGDDLDDEDDEDFDEDGASIMFLIEIDQLDGED